MTFECRPKPAMPDTSHVCLFSVIESSAQEAFTAQIQVDDLFLAFADGVGIGYGTTYTQTFEVEVPAGSQVLAIRAQNVGGPAGINVVGDYIWSSVSEFGWKCTGTNTRGWKEVGFDDSDWADAELVQNSTATGSPSWVDTIWLEGETSESGAQTIFCRGYIDYGKHCSIFSF